MKYPTEDEIHKACSIYNSNSEVSAFIRALNWILKQLKPQIEALEDRLKKCKCDQKLTKENK